MKDANRMYAIETIAHSIDVLQHALDDLRKSLMTLAADTACAEQPVAERHLECLSRNVPEGYDTVLGYLAKCRPDMLDLMDYEVPETTARDGFWLAHRYKKCDYVPAPPVLRKKGIMRVRCWPVGLLAERFG
jgi:hypothetical protein